MPIAKLRAGAALDQVRQVIARHSCIVGCAFLALAAFVTYFLHFRSFGLYEDDYFYVSQPMGWNADQLASHIRSMWSSWPQGRPVGYTLPQVLTFYGLKLGGLPTLYLIAFAIFALNCCLVYVLLRRVASTQFALIGALAFCVFPADTTRPFLMHAFGLQTSLTFVLIASVLYFSRLRPVSYLIAVGSLLTYESAYMIFLAIPLLAHKWDRRFVVRWVGHLLVCIATIVALLAVRNSMGEGRVVQFSSTLAEAAVKIALSLVIGPAVSMGLSVFRPLYTLIQLNAEVLLVAIAAFASLILIFALFEDAPDGQPQARNPTAPDWKMLIAALAILCAGYLASFTHFPPIRPFGRLTSVHLAASIGASILFAWIWTQGIPILIAKWQPHLSRWVQPALAACLALLIGYGLLIQRDYVQSWRGQRRFWTDVIRLVPDLSDGTLILVPKSQLPDTQAIHTHSWADAIVLEQIYSFPADWNAWPRLFAVANWQDTVVWKGDVAMWLMPSGMWPEQMSALPNRNVIMLEVVGDTLVRRTGTLQLQGRPFELKPPPSDGKTVALRPGPLYDLLITQ